jgi:hypothetical protein
MAEKTIAEKISDSLRSPIIQALDDEGITLPKLAQSLAKELEADETKFFSHQGQIIEQANVIAWDVRQRARQDAHRLRGDYPAEERKVRVQVTHLTPEEEEIAKKIEEELLLSKKDE